MTASDSSDRAAELPLFSYGTLQRADIQQATFGRLLDGVADILPGFRLDPLTVDDPDLVALLGSTTHIIATRGAADDRIDGQRLVLTEAELVASDDYEVEPYTRIEVTLASGTRAFVYAAPDAADGTL